MKILKIYKQKLRYKNYSPRTIKTYVNYLKCFLQEQSITDPYQVTTYKIKQYLELKTYSSISQQNQYIGSLKLFAKYILNKKQIHIDKIERPRKPKKLPLVIDGDFLKTKIINIQNLKHKAILTLGYGCGLRVGEVINLKITDVDGNRMVLHIKKGKGQKDRLVKISQSTLELLRSYYRVFKPSVYLFNGSKYNLQYTSSSCNKLVKRYIGPCYHFHQLRHSYATTLLENGTDITVIQKLLGHSRIKTTMQYAKVTNKAFQRVETPL